MRLGIFGQVDSLYVRILCQAAVERGHEITALPFESMFSKVSDGKIAVHCGEHNLASFNALIVRTMPPGTLEQVIARMDLLAGVEAIGVPVLNPPKALECAVDKYLTTQKLALAGIPVPTTVVCESAETALEQWERMGQDVVVKPLFGAEGRGIVRVTDREIAMRVFRTLERIGAVLYLQSFLNGPRFDLRLLLLDGQLLGSMKRIPQPGEFRANISQNGTGVPHQPLDYELYLAREAARVTGTVFAGVDLMYDSEGFARVIEVNAVPGWRGLQQACQVDVPKLLLQWLESKIVSG